jgi:AcrR family transcriptional regulator
VARPKIHDDALRANLLERAGALLSLEGPAGLSLRRLAADAGTSTTAVYSLFGGKPGLVREVYMEAFRRFGAQLTEVPVTGDALHDLAELGWAYRANALTNPHLYTVMFGRALPDFEPDDEVRAESGRAMQVLVDAVERAMAAAALGRDDPRRVAMTFWATVHGLVSLELDEHLPHRPGEQDFGAAMTAIVRGWAPQPGDAPDE